MDVEHSRLLKFFTERRPKPEMADPPTIKILKDYESPANLEAEVPGTHKIRQHDGNNSQDSNATTSEIQITGAEFTLSPVITVTKKESTLTKGDMKLQKVTVSEDIAVDESENGGYRITRVQTSVESDIQPASRTVLTSESRIDTSYKEEKTERERCQDEKKSKIPIMRLRQAVEKVKLERQAQKARQKPRRSSIPKLKDTNIPIKRETSLQIHPRYEDEFEKIYEEIVDNPQKEIDDNILAVKIEDTEKIESKFEEIIHAYDDDSNKKPTVSRISKIPALRRDDSQPSKIGALVDRVKAKNTITETKLKDGGFKVSASTITTKRFSRGNSRDLSKDDQKADITETIDIKESGDNNVVVTETVKKVPVKPERSIRSINKKYSRDGQKIDIVETIQDTEHRVSKKIARETGVKERIKLGTPVNTEKLLHDINKEDVKNVSTNVKLDHEDNSEIVTIEEIKDGGSQTITTKTEYVTETPVKTERIIRGIRRETNKDSQNINTMENFEGYSKNGASETVTLEEFKDGGRQTIRAKTTIRESVNNTYTPIITEPIFRNNSREVSTETQNIDINIEKDKSDSGIMTIKETKHESTKKITKETFTRDNIEVPLKTERFTRDISREMGNIRQKEDRENVTIEETNNNGSQTRNTKTLIRKSTKVGIPVKTEGTADSISRQIKKVSENVDIINKEITTTENNKRGHKYIEEIFVDKTDTGNTLQNDDITNKEIMKRDDNRDVIQKKVVTAENIIKESINVGIPVFTKVTQSYSKGKIQNVEISRTFEWKPADEVKTSKYNRSMSEKVTKKELKGIDNRKLEAQTSLSEDSDTRDERKVKIINKNDILNTRDRQPKDPVLEKNIEDAMKDISNVITFDKVTEYRSKEQETKVEKTTYSLNKTGSLSVEKDCSKEPKVIDNQVSLTTSKDLRENGFKESSTELSTEIINKQSVKTDTDNVNSDMLYSDLSMIEKESETEKVTILKGNVSRLKQKIGTKENVGVSKRESNENILKKESILSKIAIFERLEPTKIIPKEKKMSKLVPKAIKVEEKPKIVNEVLKEQPKLDSDVDTENVEIGLNYKEVIYKNEPVIVNEIWKSNDSMIQNVSSINHDIKEEMNIFKMQENAVDKTVRNNDYGENLQEQIDFRTDESNPHESIIVKVGKAIQTKNDIVTDSNRFELPEILPDKIDFETEIGKTKPGKIDLNIWKTQVEVNKTLVDNIDIIRNENLEEIVKTLPSKSDFKTYTSRVQPSNAKLGTIEFKKDEILQKIPIPSPGKIDIEIKTKQLEVTDTFPGEIPFKIDESQVKNKVDSILLTHLEFNENNVRIENKYKPIPGTIEFKAHEIHAEIVKPLRGKIYIDVNKNQDKVMKPLPAKIDFTAGTNQIELPKILPEKKDYLKPDKNYRIRNENDVEAAKHKPGKLNLNLWENQVEVNKTQVGKLSIKNNEQSEMAKSLPGKIGFTTLDSQVQEIKPSPGKADLKINDYNVDLIRELPAKIYNNITDAQVHLSDTTTGNQVEVPQNLPFKFDSPTTQNEDEEHKALPEEQDHNFKSEVNQAGFDRALQDSIDIYEYQMKANKACGIYCSTSKNETEVIDVDIEIDEKQIEIENTLPGKLDLKAWENQVEGNKTHVGTTSFKTEEKLIGSIKAQDEKPKILARKNSGNKLLNTQTPQEKIDLKVNKYENEYAKSFQGELNFETSENEDQINNVYMDREKKGLDSDIIPKKNDKNILENKSKISSDLEPRESLSDPELVDEADVDVKKNKESIIGKIKRKMYFITDKNITHIPTNTHIQIEVSAVNDPKESDNQKVEEMETKTHFINDENIDQNTIDETKPIEQIVTSDTCTTTESIFKGSIQNGEEKHIVSNYKKKIPEKEFEPYTYYKRTGQNNSHIEVIATEHITDNHFNKKETIIDIFEYNLNTDKVRNEYTRSGYDTGDFKSSKEDLQRAKSLAELDLGDVIQGQVRRMVGRMKSVDFDRKENVKVRKISIKEMPKKMSVLEKIALFESKASPSRVESTTFKTRTTTQNTPQVISDEVYMQKIEELTSAKIRLGRLKDMLYLPLSSGVEMPVIALGTALVDNRLLSQLIGAAIDLGYRAIDTAYIYGNEKEIGQAIKAKIDDGTVKREDLFIISKLWSTYHRPDLVEEACRTSLENMGLDYFDLYMIHNPMSFKEGAELIPKIATVLQYSQYDYLDAWFGMEALVTKGLVKSIGVSNFNSQQIQRILDKGKLKPVVNQVECHPYLSQQRLHTFCAERNITLSCFGVLGSKGTPPEYKSSVTPVIDDALVQVMASGLNVSPAQLLIRYQIECGHNVVVKSSSAAHLWDNLQALTFTLNKTQVDALHALNRNKRIFTFKGMGDTHKNYPFMAGY